MSGECRCGYEDTVAAAAAAVGAGGFIELTLRRRACCGGACEKGTAADADIVARGRRLLELVGVVLALALLSPGLAKVECGNGLRW